MRLERADGSPRADGQGMEDERESVNCVPLRREAKSALSSSSALFPSARQVHRPLETIGGRDHDSEGRKRREK